MFIIDSISGIINIVCRSTNKVSIWKCYIWSTKYE